MKIETATIARLRDTLIQSGQRQGAVISTADEILTRQGLLSGDENAAVARVAPMAETMFLVMAADGKISEGEMDAIRGAVRDLTDGLLQEGTIKVLLENFQRSLDAEGRASRLAAVASSIKHSSEDAEGAFALAAAVAMADHEVAYAENQLLIELSQLLGIGSQRAHVILDQLDEERSSEPPPDTERNPSRSGD